MTPEIAQFTNRGMNQDISDSKATNEFAFKNHNIRITAVNDNTLLSITNEKLPGDLIVDVTGKKRIPNKITIENPLLNVHKITLEYPPTSVVNVRVIFEDDSIISVPIITPNKIGVFTTFSKIKNAEVISKDPNFIYYYGDEVPTETGSKYKTIFGVYLGHAILNEYLVLFTKSSTTDYIYIFTYDDATNTIVGNIKYEGDLNFSLDHPIETLPYYESEEVQKVYWVDGLNQPRVINIVADDIVERLNTQFDFNPTIAKFPNVTVTKEYSGIGLFPAGVIQYFISYYNKFGAETGIVWASDLQYVTEYNRAAGPDENVVCSFKINIDNVDTTYGYARVYSMQRTSLNTTPICRIVADVNINNSDSISVVDTNTNTETIDPTQLLFLGGDTFIASTLAQKDDTLFLGDLTIDSLIISNELKEILKPKDGTSISPYIRWESDKASGYKEVSMSYVAGFKYGDWYRFGIQFQDSTGKWTIPMWIGDSTPHTRINGRIYPTFSIEAVYNLNEDKDVTSLLSKYTNYRLLMVETNSSTRNVLAQGVVNPTVFNLEQRVNKTGPFAIGSWINRPRRGNANYEHLSPLGNTKVGDDYINLPTCEIQNSFNKFPILENTEKDYMLSFEVRTGGNWIDVAIYEIEDDPTIESKEYDKFNPSNILVKKEYESIQVYSGYIDSQETYDRIINWFISKGIASEKLLLSYSDYKDYIYKTLYSTGDMTYFGNIVEINNLWFAGLVGGDESGFSISPNIAQSIKMAGAYTIVNTQIPKEINLKEYTNSWYVDTSIVTLNSPDLENNKALLDNVANLNFRIIGLAHINSTDTDITIRTKTNPIKSDGGLVKSLWKETNKKLLNAPIYQDYAWTKDGKLDKQIIYDYYVYLWNKKGSITGQTSESYKEGSSGDKESFDIIHAELEHKIIANRTNSDRIEYLKNSVDYNNITPRLFDSSQIQSVGFDYLGESQIYQGNYNYVGATEGNNPYKVFYRNTLINNNDGYGLDQYDPVSIKFNKPQHLVIALQEGNNPALLPYVGTDDSGEAEWSIYGEYGKEVPKDSDGNIIPPIYPWFDDNTQYVQKSINLLRTQPYLYIGEIYRDKTSNELYGEPTQNNLEKHNWIPISFSTSITDNITDTWGDTYYQRWECLNTVPSTEEDLNSVVDIVSFMVETHINLEGRYDENKDSLNILNVRETNFNLINPVYSQTDNYFIYNILDDKFNQTKYGNQVAFSLQKTPTLEIDTWCNITLASSFNLNGLYGKLTKLINVNDSILAFQDKALSVINFNNRTALSTESGVPIEIANSGKVNGYSVLSSNVGCQNKQSICQASSGVYFIDDYNKAMYGFNKEGLSNISSKGMSMWFKKNLTGKEKTFYDSLTNDIYVTNINDCLVFNEGLQTFTSFMDYNNINVLFNFNGYSLMLDKDEQDAIIPKKMFSGDYANNYSIEYKINPEPLIDKTFGNIEFIADCIGEQKDIDSDSVQYYYEIKPFDLLQVWNEYQRGTTNLHTARFRYPNSEKKFRIWRVDIPRDDSNHRDRIRNPWVYLKLSKSTDLNHTKMVFHNLLVKYYK